MTSIRVLLLLTLVFVGTYQQDWDITLTSHMDAHLVLNQYFMTRNEDCGVGQLDMAWFKHGASGCKNCPEDCSFCGLDDDLKTAKCIVCGWGHYLESDGECMPCAEGCHDCIGPAVSECYEAAPGYWWNDASGALVPLAVENCDIGEHDAGECIQCLPGYVCTVDSHGDHCSACTECSVDNCEVCYQSQQKCAICEKGYEISNGACSKGDGDSRTHCEWYDYDGDCLWCEWGYGLSSSGNCVACAEGCSYCSGGYCYACEAGYGQNLNGGCDNCDDIFSGCTECYLGICAGCKMGLGVAVIDQKCKSCDDHCLSCSMINILFLEVSACDWCEVGYHVDISSQCVKDSAIPNCVYQIQGTCVECHQHYYLDTFGDCEPCDNQCSRCHGPSEYDCESCPLGQYLAETYDGWYGVQHECEADCVYYQDWDDNGKAMCSEYGWYSWDYSYSDSYDFIDEDWLMEEIRGPRNGSSILALASMLCFILIALLQ